MRLEVWLAREIGTEILRNNSASFDSQWQTILNALPPDWSGCMWYGYLADAVVIAHVGYVAYVVVGQFLIMAGALFRRQWVRNFWFRITHLFAILVVALEAAMGWTCPLTTWEHQLRTMAGQGMEAGSFMGRLFQKLIFFRCSEQVFDAMHIGFAVLVLLTLVLVRPRSPWQRQVQPTA